MNIIGINTVRRRFPYHGTLSSETLCELVEEIVQDFTTIAKELNDSVQPVISSLPGGRRQITEADRIEDINPVINGLDGSQLYLDATAQDPYNPLLYNREKNRPNTIKEAMQYLLMRIEQLAHAISQ